ncbi:MAG: hypothetical protein QOJ29_2 [Thermoleophilaceae bacterium]|jgi:plastocyanin|nr:hypothetical protein [Thermoleophilaceae bacterium]
MRIRFAVALAAGFSAALAIATFPAQASNATIAAAGFSWNPSTATIAVGESVTWTTDGGLHNVCVLKPGSAGPACDEFNNGPKNTDWSGYTNSHSFTTAGTYRFYCQQHGDAAGNGMAGTITVTGGGGTTTTSTGTGTGTGTGTSTTPPPDTQPTDTTTVPTQTETSAAAADTTAPAFTGKLKRRSSRKTLILELNSSEDATLTATVFRHPPGKGFFFGKVGQASLEVKKGHNVITLPRKAAGKLRSGSYKVKLQLVDAAGNRSPSRQLSFKLS